MFKAVRNGRGNGGWRGHGLAVRIRARLQLAGARR
jgi:hypothetical protein